MCAADPQRVQPRPDDPTSAYATSAGMRKTYCEQDCRSLWPLPPRNDELQNVWAIQLGDALFDLRRTGQARVVPWRPIAIIQSLTGPLNSTTLTSKGRPAESLDTRGCHDS